jgi:putative transposase
MLHRVRKLSCHCRTVNVTGRGANVAAIAPSAPNGLINSHAHLLNRCLRISGLAFDLVREEPVRTVRSVVRCERRTITLSGNDRRAPGSRVPVPVTPLRRITPALRAPRLDGQGRRIRRQRRNGIVLLAAAKNVLDRQRWLTRQDLRLAITTWIEKTYHRRRRQRRLGKLTPIEYETINRTALTAA